MSYQTSCKGCGASILMIETEHRKWMPVDLPEQTFITRHGRLMKGYISHFATCPDADRFRRKDQK